MLRFIAAGITIYLTSISNMHCLMLMASSSTLTIIPVLLLTKIGQCKEKINKGNSKLSPLVFLTLLRCLLSMVNQSTKLFLIGHFQK